MVLALGLALASTVLLLFLTLWDLSLPDKRGLHFSGLTSEELQKKMSGTYYGKEIGKERSSRTSGKGTKDVYLSKWPFFASLHFLRDNITPRKTSSNLDIDMSEEKENEAVDHNQPSQQATQQVPDDGSVEGNVFPTDNPPSVKIEKREHYHWRTSFFPLVYRK